MEEIRGAIADLSSRLGLSEAAGSLILLVAAGCIAHLLLAFVLRRLHKLGDITDNDWDDAVVDAASAPLRVALWIGVILIALQIYPLPEQVQGIVMSLPDTALVLLLGWFGIRLIRGVEEELVRAHRADSSRTEPATVHATAKIARLTLCILAALMVLQSLGVSISGLLAFGGVGGIAVGFAAKDILANLLGGLSIHLDRPFTVGDWIRSPDKQIEGTVENIGWRLTRIRTFDQRPLYVPNAFFSQIALENPSRMHARRIKETIGLRYQDSSKIQRVISEVRDMLRDHEGIDTSRTLIVNFNAFGASSLDFFVYTFTKTTDWVEFHRVKEDVLLKIYDIVYRNGADVAFPTTTLQLETVPEEPSA